MVKRAVILSLAFFAMVSCNQEPEQKVIESRQAAPKIMPPFRFHRAVEIKPGLTLDIVSWGRGSDSVGGYLILRSDSTHLDYRSVTGELDGQIVDVWDMDLDSDGDPELYIQARGEGEGSFLNMYIYEYSDNGTARKINFPDLSSAGKKGYQGKDSVYVKEGRLLREFPVVDTPGTLQSKGGMIRKFEYSLNNNSFNVKEIKEPGSSDQ